MDRAGRNDDWVECESCGVTGDAATDPAGESAIMYEVVDDEALSEEADDGGSPRSCVNMSSGDIPSVTCPGVDVIIFISTLSFTE